MERELRTSAPEHATGAVEFVPLDALAADETFRLRADGDVSALATSIGRTGQLVPIEVRPWSGAGEHGPRWQVVAGFRRLAAVRMLARDRVLARVHGQLADEDAWALALSEALLREPLMGSELEALRARLGGVGASWAEDLVDEALVRAPVPEALREKFFEFLTGVAVEREEQPEEAWRVEVGAMAGPAGQVAIQRPEAQETVEEVTPEELASSLAARLCEINQDLAAAWDVWNDLPEQEREAIAEQARWIAAIAPYMVDAPAPAPAPPAAEEGPAVAQAPATGEAPRTGEASGTDPT